jgi:hypothetical protein
MNLAEIRAMARYLEPHGDEGRTHWDGCETVHGWCAARVLLERMDTLEAALRPCGECRTCQDNVRLEGMTDYGGPPAIFGTCERLGDRIAAALKETL